MGRSQSTKSQSTNSQSPKSRSAKSPATKPKTADASPLISSSALPLSNGISWPKETELLSLEFVVQPLADCELYPQYTVGLHAWFLDQMRQLDPTLSAYLHDGESEKPFSLTGLSSRFSDARQSIPLRQQTNYRWRVNALSQRVCQGLAVWLGRLPKEIALNDAPLKILSVDLALPPRNYTKMLRGAKAASGNVSLSFSSPTSFRRKGHHLPLPWPTNVFHSYLRRWNHFAPEPVDQDDFLDWVDDFVIVQRHQMASVKVAVGKRGAVTGFTGSITYGLDKDAIVDPDFQALFYALASYAPFCGTGHKTTFGLGETQAGWVTSASPAPVPPTLTPAPSLSSPPPANSPSPSNLSRRIKTLTDLFLSQRKRQGGSRAKETAKTWATIIARREQGESLQSIADRLKMPYGTVKTYAKLARRAMKEEGEEGEKV